MNQFTSKKTLSKLPCVSIIVPNYNHSLFLIDRIESVLNQTYQNIQVILLDDRSSDHSREILRSYAMHPKVSHLLENEYNSGNTFVQWGKGVSVAAGDLIWIAESDDWAEPNFLETLVPLLEVDGSLEAVFCRSKRIDSDGRDLGLWDDHLTRSTVDEFAVIKLTSSSLIDFMVDGNCIPNASSVLLRKRAFALLDPEIFTYRLNGDWIFWIKVIESGNIGYCPKPLNFFRHHNTNVRSRVEASGENLLEYLRVLGFMGDLRPGDKKILGKVASIVKDLHLRHARGALNSDVYKMALAEVARMGVKGPGYQMTLFKHQLRSIYNECFK